MAFSHRSVRFQQQGPALLEAAMDAKLSEVTYACNLSIHIGIEFESSATADQLSWVLSVGEHQLIVITRYRRGMKRVRFSCKQQIDIAIERVFSEQLTKIALSF